MSEEISGFGTIITIAATATFPYGFTVTQFADNADPLDMASIKIADVAMGVNGDLIRWSRAVPIPMVLNVIPGGEDDTNLGILAEANRAGQGKLSARDDITANIIYPDGSQVTLSGGSITDAMPARSVSSDRRIKTKTYAFAFQNKVGV